MAYDIALQIGRHDLLTTESCDLLLIDNAERVAQQIRIKLKSFLREWFLDMSYGVPYFEYILVKQPNMTHIRSILRQQISDVADVSKVQELTFSLDRQNRALAVEYVAETTFGLVTGKEVLGYE